MNGSDPHNASGWSTPPMHAAPRYAPPVPRYAPPSASAQPAPYAPHGIQPPHAQYSPHGAHPSSAPPYGARPSRGALERTLDHVLSAQRPAVLAHLRSVRRRHRDAAPTDLVRALELRYLALVTTTGAGIGATAIIPAIGTATTLALSGAETVGFLESTALFAQSVAEVHGIAVDDPDRARALVMALMLGSEAAALVSQFGSQAVGGPTRSAYWGEVVASTLPRAVMSPLADQLKKKFVHEFSKRGGASFLGKALPFGIGAAIGGVGNNLLGRKVVRSSRLAFGPAPVAVPLHIEPPGGAPGRRQRSGFGQR